MNREVVVVSGVRTAIGTFGGSLKDQTPTQLGAAVLREACRRAAVGADDVHHVVFGHVVNTEPRDLYLHASPRSRAVCPKRHRHSP